MCKHYYKRYSKTKTDVMAEALTDALGMAPEHLILCLHAKSQLIQGAAVIDVLPDSLINDLKKKNIGMYNGKVVYLLTDKIRPNCGSGGVAIAPFINLNLLPQIESCVPAAIIYIPWMESELPLYSALPDAEEI